MSETIQFDLRKRLGNQKHFGLKDIVYSYDQINHPDTTNVTKMIIIEKQPNYPLYTHNYYDAAYNFGSGVITSIANSIAKKLGKENFELGSTGSELAVGGLRQLMNNGQNSLVNSHSKYSERIKGGNDNLWNLQSKALSPIKNLFTVLAEANISTYELPYFSEYFLEASGSQGWEANGIEAHIGKFAKIVEQINVGYPVTPNWKYDGRRLRTEFTFNLLNNDSNSLKKNMKFIMAIIPGMMHVLLPAGDMISNALKDGGGNNNGLPFQSPGEKMISKIGNAAKDVASDIASKLDDYLGKLTTMFKSPNVYEVIVPGRFRWLWCTMDMSIKYKGKIYNDNLNDLGLPVYEGSPELIGFPEAFEIAVTVESLLPQSYNEFINFVLDNNFSAKDNMKETKAM